MEQQRRVQMPEAVDLLAARVRAGRRRERPAHEQREAGGADPIPARRGSRSSGGACPRSSATALQRDHDGRPEDGDREQEVRDDERRMEMCVDGDRAQRRLRGRADERGHRQPSRPARQPARPPAPTASARVRMIVTLATIRFPNSMYEW
jgi:hypothetical protein